MKASILNKLIIILLFYIAPIIDNIYGYMHYQKGIDFPISSIFRMIVIGMITLSLIRVKGIKEILLKFGAAVSLLVCMWTILYGASPSYEIQYLTKVAYIPLLMMYFVKRKFYNSFDLLLRYVTNYGLIISAIVVVTFTLGIGNYSYGGGSEGAYGFGMKGFFKAGNDLGLTIVMCLCMSFLYYIKFAPKLFNLMKCFLIAIGGVLIGSRVGMILSPLLLGCFILYLAFTKKRIIALKYRFLIIALFGFISIQLATFVISSFDTYMFERFEIENIGTARTILIDGAKKYIAGFEGIDLLFGKGQYMLAKTVSVYVDAKADEKSVEADWYDMVGGYGYVLGMLIVLFYYYFTYKLFRLFVYKKDFESMIVFMCSMIFIMIGHLAGHAVTNMMVAPVMGVMAYYKSAENIVLNQKAII